MRRGNSGEDESMVQDGLAGASLGGSFEDAVCPLGGPRAVARTRRWPPVGMAACCNSASLACRLAAPGGWMHAPPQHGVPGCAAWRLSGRLKSRCRSGWTEGGCRLRRAAWMLAGNPVERESPVAGQPSRGLARWQLRGRAACSYAATGAGGTQNWQSRWPGSAALSEAIIGIYGLCQS